tara:strand:- start:13097 stop:13495 length:399 start_codon:yes stop_codon:yes gene_type:complete
MGKRRGVIAVINYQGNVLIGRKNPNSPKFFAGAWHIPGETTKKWESDEAALIRGMKEETGLDVWVGQYLASHVSPTGKSLSWYECFSGSDCAVAGSDLVEVKWVKKQDVIGSLDRKVVSLWDPKIHEYFGKV